MRGNGQELLLGRRDGSPGDELYERAHQALSQGQIPLDLLRVTLRARRDSALETLLCKAWVRKQQSKLGEEQTEEIEVVSRAMRKDFMQAVLNDEPLAPSTYYLPEGWGVLLAEAGVVGGPLYMRELDERLDEFDAELRPKHGPPVYLQRAIEQFKDLKRLIAPLVENQRERVSSMALSLLDAHPQDGDLGGWDAIERDDMGERIHRRDHHSYALLLGQDLVEWMDEGDRYKIGGALAREALHGATNELSLVISEDLTLEQARFRLTHAACKKMGGFLHHDGYLNPLLKKLGYRAWEGNPLLGERVILAHLSAYRDGSDKRENVRAHLDSRT